MKFSLLLSLSLVLAACGGSDKPDPTTPSPDPTTEEPSGEPTGEPTMMTNEECTAAGGTVVGDIGDGSVQCAAGMSEIGNVSGGIEEQLCCKTPDEAE